MKRKGKFSEEEKSFTRILIKLFEDGLLPLNNGTPLRQFLANILRCDPHRISTSKDFKGIGHQVFRRNDEAINSLSPKEIGKTISDLKALEEKFNPSSSTQESPQQSSRKDKVHSLLEKLNAGKYIAIFA